MQDEIRKVSPPWGGHDPKSLERYFALLRRENPALIIPENAEGRKAFLQERGYLSEEMDCFTPEGILLFGRPSQVGLYTDVLLIDRRQEPARETHFSNLPILELYDQLVQALKVLWQRQFSSTAIRDKSWGERIFYEYPIEAVLEALGIFLAQRDYTEAISADITLTSDSVQFQLLSPPNPILDETLRELGLGHGEKGGEYHIRKALRNNLSYRRDGSLGLETGESYLTLFRRDPSRAVSGLRSELERQVADAYRQMGARTVKHDVELAGNRIDVYVELETPGRLLHRTAVEVKNWSETVGIDVVNRFAAVAGLLRRRNLIDEGVIVSASGFSKHARNAAKTYGILLLEPADLDAVVNNAQAAVASSHQPRDLYSRYETGLRELLERLGQEHPYFPEVLVYQHRLSENISRARRSGDTKASQAERAEIIEQLNRLALRELRRPFNDLCSPTPRQTDELPREQLPELVLIPPGPFWMGSPLEDAEAHGNEKPRRKLDLREYGIGRYPITNAQYARFVIDTGHRVPEHWDEGRVPAGLEDHPVVNVSYGDAEAYCRWLSQVAGQHYHLPTEEEWEKAARGELPEVRRYPWGDEWQPDICNTKELGWDGTTSVHKFEQVNQSPFGVVDMAGNVWEWTSSWYERYLDSPHVTPNYGQLYRVVRGGSWRSRRQATRASCRGRYRPDEWRPYLGFRIASDVSVR